MSKYSVRKVKTFRGREGHGFNAELLCDNIPVAFVMDEANGGTYHYEWYDLKSPRIPVEVVEYGRSRTLQCTPEEAKLRAAINGKTYTCEINNQVYDVGIDMFVGMLVDEWETVKKAKRAERASRRNASLQGASI